MNPLLHSCIGLTAFTLLITGGLNGICSAALVYELPPSKGYSGIHAKGQACLNTDRKEWHHARNEHFILHGKSREQIRQIEREAEHAWYKLGYQLGLKTEKEPIHIVIISNLRQWEKLLGTENQDHGDQDHAEKRAAFLGNTIFLLRAGPVEEFPTDLAHEIVHARLTAAYPEIPLWLEEALALDLGIELTMAFHKSRGHIMKPRPVEMDQWEQGTQRIDQFTNAYPSDLIAFYRQCRLFIAAVKTQITAAQLRTFVQSTAGNERSWQDVLALECQIPQDQIKELENETILHIKKTE